MPPNRIKFQGKVHDFNLFTFWCEVYYISIFELKKGFANSQCSNIEKNIQLSVQHWAGDYNTVDG